MTPTKQTQAGAPDDAETFFKTSVARSRRTGLLDGLSILVRDMGSLINASLSFVAVRDVSTFDTVWGIASWRQGKERTKWSYSLKGNPCLLPYKQGFTFLPCDVAEQFEGKRKSDYQSFVGFPLQTSVGFTYGHIALYSKVRLEEGSIDQIPLENFHAEIEKICNANRTELMAEVISAKTET